MGRHAIGIDLGTTHSALSWYELSSRETRKHEETTLPIPQLTAPGTIEERVLLPSFLYLPNDSEFPSGSLVLPWDKKLRVWQASSHGAMG